ncbi:MAG: TMEM175 family protein [Acidimicrobiia bacterium]
MTEASKPGRRPGLRTGRLEAFSDGVFAIAITLLVLDLSVPPGSGDDLLGTFFDQWPSYLAYLVSFATIGSAWIGHTVITAFVDRTDSGFARLNLLLLLVVSFLPFPTSLVAEYITEEEAVRVAVTILGINLLLIALVSSTLWRHAVRRSLVRPDTADDEVRLLTQRLTPGLAGYLVLIALGLFLPLAAVFGYLLIALILILPLRRGGSPSPA